MASLSPPEDWLPAPGPALRLEEAADTAFLRALFETSRPLAAQLAHLPETLRTQLLDMQFHAQHQGYKAQFPQAQPWIITSAGQNAGRLLYDVTDVKLYIVDIALLPGWRSQGIGSALLTGLARAAAPRGLSLEVADDNFAAQRLYARLGFALTAQRPGYWSLARLPGN